ncbi:MAG: Trp family transcriptional regulator [Patescibacteria group bacterium]
MRSLRLNQRRAKSKSQIMTMGGTGEYYIAPENIIELANIVSRVTPTQLPKLLTALLTPRELVDIVRRIIIAKLLLDGETFNNITKKTSASCTTIKLVKSALESQDGLLIHTIGIKKHTRRKLELGPEEKYLLNRIKKGK